MPFNTKNIYIFTHSSELFAIKTVFWDTGINKNKRLYILSGEKVFLSCPVTKALTTQLLAQFCIIFSLHSVAG